jgi:hypothetical protein
MDSVSIPCIQMNAAVTAAQKHQRLFFRVHLEPMNVREHDHVVAGFILRLHPPLEARDRPNDDRTSGFPAMVRHVRPFVRLRRSKVICKGGLARIQN